MTTTIQTYVTTPSSEELETAWWELMQGELGIERDSLVTQDFQQMLDILKRNAERGYAIMEADGEPVAALSSKRTAERLVRAYAELFYGV